MIFIITFLGLGSVLGLAYTVVLRALPIITRVALRLFIDVEGLRFRTKDIGI